VTSTRHRGRNGSGRTAAATCGGFVASLILLSTVVVVLSQGVAALGWSAVFIPLGLYAAWKTLR
jgi:hypothetical protein